jgi:flagellar L-ring protein precursor FlgH
MKTKSASASEPSAARRSSRTASLAAALCAALLPLAGLRAESLWPAAGRGPQTSMFADRKAAAPGDILTIVVSESVAASNSQSTKSSRDSSVADAVSSFFYPTTGLHKGALPSLSLSGKASNSGGGDISNTQSLTARAAVLVSDVLPNGNLVIEGVRVVTFSGETQYVVLHGIVRADDVAPDNTIASSNIADARLEFYTEGQLTDAQKRGWFGKLYEKLRPF